MHKRNRGRHTDRKERSPDMEGTRRAPVIGGLAAWTAAALLGVATVSAQPPSPAQGARHAAPPRQAVSTPADADSNSATQDAAQRPALVRRLLTQALVRSGVLFFPPPPPPP